MYSAKELYTGILIVWLIVLSVIQPEPFSKDLCIFVVIIVDIYWNALSMSLSLIIISAFELE